MIKLQSNSTIRLLTFVKERVDASTKSIRWAIEHGRCFVNGQVERFSSTQLKAGDRITFWPAELPRFAREENRVLYEDEQLLFYNKPPYLDSPTLAKILNVHLVHRLDRDTTGVIVFAKKSPKKLEELFRNREVKKTYHTVVHGHPEKTGSCTASMRKVGKRQGAIIWGVCSHGLTARTDWKREKTSDKMSLLRCSPHTGRTHQIRVHMRAIGHPIVGDCEYGPRTAPPGLFRPLLHASTLEINGHTISAPLPADFLEFIKDFS